jgi:hypothetical protein
MRDYLFPAQKKENNYYINVDGKIIYEMAYSRCGIFCNGYASVFDGKFYGIINNKAELKIKPKYANINGFAEGVFPVQLDNKWGLIDENEQVLIDFKYDVMGICSFGLIGVEIKKGYTLSYVDKGGNVIIQDNGARVVSTFQEGYIASRDDEKCLHGFRNVHGEWAINPVYTSATEFSSGLAGVTKLIKKKELTGFIDKNGNEVLPFIYNTTIPQFKDGLAVVIKSEKKEDLFGAINLKGEVVIEPTLKYLQDFSDGLAMFRTVSNGKAGFMDTNGNVVIEEKYKYNLPFKNGLAKVQDEKGWLYINKKGEEIWRFE